MTEPEAYQIAANGHYDGDSDTLTVTCELEGATLTATYDPSDEGAAILDIIWRSFPNVLSAVVENLEDQVAQAQADEVTGPGTAAAVSNA